VTREKLLVLTARQQKQIEALQAEGVDMHHRGYELTHRLKLFAEGYDIYGKGVGPLVGDYPGYPPGSLPVSEEAHRRILGMPVFIEEEPGYSDQVIAAFKKVTSHYRELL
jgi:dTDP-4-amino-4,6-dideoxygalactose transaminase